MFTKDQMELLASAADIGREVAALRAIVESQRDEIERQHEIIKALTAK
jgi:hypothetical protein